MNESIHLKTTNNVSRLKAKNITLGYQGTLITQSLSIDIPDAKFTVIIGPNGCGKSTLLRGLSRLLTPSEGCITFDDKDLESYSRRSLAKQLGLLPQSAIAPSGITVYDLVARGRFPHQTFLRRWTQQDETAVSNAVSATQIEPLLDKTVESLSGGQRQRVWVAMVLAQETPYLLLDEPTTYLDISHQIELLELFKRLNQKEARTVVAVLHDLNHACRYADHLVVMKSGKVIAEGTPKNTVSKSLIKEVYGLDCIVVDDPLTKTPMIVPEPQSE
ncbi:ABC transporter ATP-binding protein [Vibrio sonorensis]|uniref:ABC transporter ATP-binding protein n=1 Tax=Vibrio sonorensis TaxID=1004316 RepID=UPI000B17A994|nr:ABC transporter ATP-binding protein [Vibrio sonorensis]